MFGQTFEINDIAIVGLLVLLEGILSIDNALVLGLLARRLPKHQQKKGLTYGLVGAFIFRFIAILTAAYLLRWRIVKLMGGAYLIYVAAKHFLFEGRDAVAANSPVTLPSQQAAQPNDPAPHPASPPSTGQSSKDAAGAFAKFWPTVFVIEITDIAFAVDSIIAAIGIVGPPPPGAARHPKLWVVMLGGFLGVVLMRFAAVIFIRLLEKFPRFETSAYLLVGVIGAKLLADWGFNTADNPHRIDFHNFHNPAFWIFWGLMIACFCIGFLPAKQGRPSHPG